MPKISDSSRSDGDRPKSCADAMFGEKTQKYGLYFIIFFLACLTIKDVVELVQDYAENSKQSDMSIRFNTSMDFPNMTFCMSSKQAKSHWMINASESSDEWDRIIDESLASMSNKSEALDPKNEWDYRLLIESYEVLSVLSSLERETQAAGMARSIYGFGKNPRLTAMRKMFTKWFEWADRLNITTEELTQKVGGQLVKHSMLVFARHTFDDQRPVIFPSVRIRWLSKMQLCWSPEFDKENFKRIDDQGKFFSTRVVTNLENLKGQSLDCMSIDMHGRDSSLNRFMEGKGRARDGLHDQLCFAEHHQLTVSVRARYKMLENDENTTACAEVNDGDLNEYDCRARCRMNLIKDTCKCLGRTLARLATEEEREKFPLCDYEKCELDLESVKIGNYSDDECREKCFPDCTQLRYELVHEKLGKTFDNMTYVEIHWGAFEYLNMEQSYVWTVWKFVAALGGAIGVWLGLSVLSVIQGVGYIYTTFVKKVVVDKKPLLEDDNEPKDLQNGNGNGYSTTPNPTTKIAVN